MSRLDDLGLSLPVLGLGAAPLGGLFSAMSDDEAHETVDAAWDGGIRHFDVAPHYGLGTAERRLGDALAARPREAYVLSTKVGRRLVASPHTASSRDDAGFDVPATSRRVWDVSPEGLRAGLRDSLDRLGVDTVDLVYLHDPDENVRPNGTLAEVLDRALPALAELREDGLVRAVGVGSKSTEALVRSARSGLVDALMVAGRYTLLEQPASDRVLPACLEAGVDVVAVGVYNSGALALPDPRRDLPYEYGEMPDEVFRRVRELASVCTRHGVTLPAAALAFPLRHPAVRSVVVGARGRREVEETLQRLATPVPDDLWSELAARGLTRPAREAS